MFVATFYVTGNVIDYLDDSIYMLPACIYITSVYMFLCSLAYNLITKWH